MRQRVMIAMALSCNPALLIADEPTTALDVTIQAQILELMADLQKRTNMSIMMITHDLGVIAETADRVVVMYCGKIVESADVRSLFQNLDAEPGRLQEIPGAVPTLYNPPAGCAFHPRCSVARNSCRRHSPRLVEIRPGHLVACDRVEET
jgi:peptide/nickel transport system ATP-binding protein